MSRQGVQSNDWRCRHWRCRHWSYTHVCYAVACVVLRIHGCSTKCPSAPTYCTVWRVQRVHRAGLLRQPRYQATCFDHVTVDRHPLASQTDLKPLFRQMDTYRGHDRLHALLQMYWNVSAPLSNDGKLGGFPNYASLTPNYTFLIPNLTSSTMPGFWSMNVSPSLLECDCGWRTICHTQVVTGLSVVLSHMALWTAVGIASKHVI